MRTSIALSAAALLLVAAGARPGPRFPDVRRPAAPAVDAPPVETPRPAAFLEILAGALLQATRSEPALTEEIPRLRAGAGPQAEDDEVALLGVLPAMKVELRKAFNLGRYRRAERLCEWILEDAPQDVMARDLHHRIHDARRVRVLSFTQTRPSPRLDAETLEDLTPEEWHEIAAGILDDRRLSLNVQQASFEWVLLELRHASGLPLVLDASTGRVRVDPLVTLRFSDVPLRQALHFVFDQVDPWLEMKITDEKTVLIRNGRDPDRY